MGPLRAVLLICYNLFFISPVGPTNPSLPPLFDFEPLNQIGEVSKEL
jgi:hypothetical protein